MSTTVAAKLIMVVDTDALSIMAKERRFDGLYSRLASRVSFILPEMTFSEALNTSKSRIRQYLKRPCNVLKGENGLMLPPHEILIRMARDFDRDPNKFDWRAIPVFNQYVNEAASNRKLWGEANLRKQNREDLQSSQDAVELLLSEAKARFEASDASSSDERPKSIDEWLQYAMAYPGGAFWKLARGLYVKAFKGEHGEDVVIPQHTSEHDIKMFVDSCPPFKAWVMALEVQCYDRVWRMDKRQRYRAERNDLMKAFYLPYCDLLLSNDQHLKLTFEFLCQNLNLSCRILNLADLEKL